MLAFAHTDLMFAALVVLAVAEVVDDDSKAAILVA